MPSNELIEIAVPADTTTTDRGRLLEGLARRLLQTQNFTVETEVRLTGTEVDLLAIEQTTGERIFVECKGYRSTISSEVLFKILGNVAARDLSAGWLVSTYALSKDAKGVRDEWQQKPPEKRRQLQIYDPSALIKRLIAAQLIVSPDGLPRPPGHRYSDDAYLLITPYGEFWALPLLDIANGIRQSVYLFQAQTGVQVSTEQTIDLVSQTDTTLAPLTWLRNLATTQEADSERLRGELQSIVRVPTADHWADYRPARPQDFVGRDQLQTDVFDLFDRILNQKSRTRLLALKAPSGWGKSSSILKIAARAHNKRNKNRVFVYAIDSRAAVSTRFGELALYTAIQEAIKAGFIPDPGALSFGGANNPFTTDSMRSILNSLANDDKLICLFFDQFEELLYKSELEPVFDEIQALCNAVDEAQENVLIGFSWKTDGTIPPEHKAYHLWHSLSDRRLEFELAPFNDNEISTALNRFAAELGQPLAPQLRRLLHDHCQGYPWLLKKLCIHIYELIQAGMEQTDMLVRSLSIQELFQKDIQRLDPSEFACIKQISVEAPAEFFKILNIYGDDTVNRLLDKRLIIRSGLRLSIYWDIFRDYVLTEKVPYIPINYIPQLNYSRYIDGLEFLLQEREITYDQLAAELGISKGTTDNLVRDLVMIGHAEASRRTEIVKALQTPDLGWDAKLVDFFSSHVVYRRMLSELPLDTVFTDSAVLAIFKSVLKASKFSESALNAYSQKLLGWFVGVGLIVQDSRSYAFPKAAPNVLDRVSRLLKTGRRRRNHGDRFLGDAPPNKTVQALTEILTTRLERGELEKLYGRNPVASLLSLNIIDADARITVPSNSDEAGEDILRRVASNRPTVVFVSEMLSAKAYLSGLEIGSKVAAEFGFEWSEGSKKRVGIALKNWAIWCNKKLKSNRRRIGKGEDDVPEQRLLELL